MAGVGKFTSSACRRRFVGFCRTHLLPPFARPPLSTVKIKLRCASPLASPREITIDSFPIELGRGVTAGVRIDDRWLSRRHCELSLDGGNVVVRDLGSTHGTFVNGQRLASARILTDGDKLQIGLSHFVVEHQPELSKIHDSAGWDAAVA